VIIINSTNNYTTQILLLITTMLLAWIQQLIKPYKCSTSNIIDGTDLQIMSFASVIFLLNSSHKEVLLVVVIFLVIIPLIVFAAVKLMTERQKIKKIITKYWRPKRDTTNDNDEASTNDFGIVIDDNMRRS